MKLMDMFALLLAVSAVFGYINIRFIKMPETIGLLVISLVSSLAVIGLEQLIPDLSLLENTESTVRAVDLPNTLLNGMLSALLFAGAMGIDVAQMRRQAFPIFLLAVGGTLLSTALIGGMMYGALSLVGVDMPVLFCLVLGAIISPTDPIAVLGLLKVVKVPPSLEAKVAGESLFNDGVGVVVFTVLAALAVNPAASASIETVAHVFFAEAIGGVVLGFVLGLIASYTLKTTNHPGQELLITLAVAVGTYMLAQKLHTGAPIAVVVSGLTINYFRNATMSAKTQKHVTVFWEGVDEILNAMLFVVIGFEVLVLSYDPIMPVVGALAIIVSLLARTGSVAVPLAVLTNRNFMVSRGALPILVWGGLRGGISVALALSLTPSPFTNLIHGATYAVVIWTIIAQGLTMPRLVRHYYPNGPEHGYTEIL